MKLYLWTKRKYKKLRFAALLPKSWGQGLCFVHCWPTVPGAVSCAHGKLNKHLLNDYCLLLRLLIGLVTTTSGRLSLWSPHRSLHSNFWTLDPSSLKMAQKKTCLCSEVAEMLISGSHQKLCITLFPTTPSPVCTCWLGHVNRSLDPLSQWMCPEKYCSKTGGPEEGTGVGTWGHTFTDCDPMSKVRTLTHGFCLGWLCILATNPHQPPGTLPPLPLDQRPFP